MTITELTQKITNSVLSEEAKKKIIDLANTYTEVTPDLEDQVKELIQEDIDKDLTALGAEENTPEIQAAQEQLDQDMASINTELDQDLESVEKELGDIETMHKQVTAAEEAHKVAQLRNDLITN